MESFPLSSPLMLSGKHVIEGPVPKARSIEKKATFGERSDMECVAWNKQREHLENMIVGNW